MNITHTTPKHTPGPWEIDAAGDIRSGVDIVAIIPSRNDSHSQIAERDANARLIAAAPELLADLTSLSNITCITCTHAGDDLECVDCCIPPIKDCISRAKGEAADIDHAAASELKRTAARASAAPADGGVA